MRFQYGESGGSGESGESGESGGRGGSVRVGVELGVGTTPAVSNWGLRKRSPPSRTEWADFVGQNPIGVKLGKSQSNIIATRRITCGMMIGVQSQSSPKRSSPCLILPLSLPPYKVCSQATLPARLKGIFASGFRTK